MVRTLFYLEKQDFSVSSAYELMNSVSNYIPKQYSTALLQAFSQIEKKYFKKPKVKVTVSNKKFIRELQIMKLGLVSKKKQPYTEYIFDNDCKLYIWAFKKKNSNYILVVLYVNKEPLEITF